MANTLYKARRKRPLGQKTGGDNQIGIEGAGVRNVPLQGVNVPKSGDPSGLMPVHSFVYGCRT